MATIRDQADEFWRKAQTGRQKFFAASALIYLGCHVCRRIEDVWRNNNVLVEATPQRTAFFPLQHTNLVPPSGTEWPGVTMRDKLGLLSPAMRKKLRRRSKSRARLNGGFLTEAEPEAVGKRPDGYLGCRPPSDYSRFNDSWPKKIKKGYAEACKETDALSWQAQKGDQMPGAATALIALGNHICRRIEDLWRRNRALVKSSAWLMSWFPTRHTRSAPPSGREWPGEAMRSELELIPHPMREEGRRGPKSHLLSNFETTPRSAEQKKRPVTLGGALLNDKIEEFVIFAVLHPNWLVWVTLPGHQAPTGEMVPKGVPLETVIIDPATRSELIAAARNNDTAKWVKVFAEKFIRPYCPEILSEDGMTGAASAIVAERRASLIKFSADDNRPWRAFKMLAQERLEKFMPQIQVVLGTN